MSSRGLLLILGIYAVLIGLRLLLLKPKMVPDGKLQAGVNVVTFIFSILTGLMSAGGKPLQLKHKLKHSIRFQIKPRSIFVAGFEN